MGARIVISEQRLSTGAISGYWNLQQGFFKSSTLFPTTAHRDSLPLHKEILHNCCHGRTTSLSLRRNWDLENIAKKKKKKQFRVTEICVAHKSLSGFALPHPSLLCKRNLGRPEAPGQGSSQIVEVRFR